MHLLTEPLKIYIYICQHHLYVTIIGQGISAWIYTSQVFNSILWNSTKPNHFHLQNLVNVGLYSSMQNQHNSNISKKTITESSYHYSSSRKRFGEWVLDSWSEEESHRHRKDPKQETKKHYLCCVFMKRNSAKRSLFSGWA